MINRTSRARRNGCWNQEIHTSEFKSSEKENKNNWRSKSPEFGSSQDETRDKSEQQYTSNGESGRSNSQGKVEEDGAQMPKSILRGRRAYEAIYQKENQSMHVIWRQRLMDGTYLKIPEDAGMPSIVIYGEKAELRLRNTESIPGMDIVRIPSAQWAYDAAMARP
jgi:hypothetical protein